MTAPATPAPADGAPGERVSAHPFVRCARCGQCDTGQTGEYPCLDCGLPTVWYDVADASDCSDAFEVAVAEYGMAAYEAKGQGFDDPAVSAAAARVFMSYRVAVADLIALATGAKAGEGAASVAPCNCGDDGGEWCGACGPAEDPR